MSRRAVVIPLLMGSFASAAAAAKREPRKKAIREKDSRGVLRAIARAPLKTRRWKGPYNDDPSAILADKKLCFQHCAECHGDDARGNPHAANLRAPGVQRATPGELEWLLWNGNLAKGMPSWSGLPPQRRWQIVAYLKSLR